MDAPPIRESLPPPNQPLASSTVCNLATMLLQHMEHQLYRADVKAQFTLTADALLLASVAVLDRDSFGVLLGSAPFITQIPAVLAVLTFLCLLVSTVYSLLSTLPNMALPRRAPINLFYFVSVQRVREKEFIDKFTTSQESDIVQMMLSEVHAVATIVKRRFTQVTISHYFMFLALAFWAVAQLLKTIPAA